MHRRDYVKRSRDNTEYFLDVDAALVLSTSTCQCHYKEISRGWVTPDEEHEKRAKHFFSNLLAVKQTRFPTISKIRAVLHENRQTKNTT